MTKGMWKGGLERIFNRSISIEEVKCKAKGDEYCEFKIEIPRG
jgi:predicted hydrocarbon binding protein